ncbi:ABC transporter ATP-binding protein [Lachnoclostridium phytofermentans]|uniref:ABC transporter related n=1 Tax=Lachnoclostridium phytofermentans (strain ATCC 700394 / DSM 18823 / ISDg) TaxID=357809 RepID=A9KNM0_LACP7|nr:ABC transporter ATP-binding protein [Lachnoclostridium phytofermentans]ABX41621.1 ABC transporter related [Lachnoclostridium phytofermentans ISDg]
MLIEIKNLKKTYGIGETTVHALKGINLSIEQGEFIAIVGTSGSGKSTLLNLIGGLDYPTEGNILINDRDIYALKPDELTIFRRRSIGFVFQSYNLVPILNVYQNIMLPLQLDNVRPDKKFLELIINTLGISEKKNSLPNNLSGGQQQRVAIARALIAHPQVILADEPTGNLDSKTALEVILLLKQLNETYGQTIIMITHDEEIAQIATRRIHIEDGRLISDTKEVFGHE